MAKKKRKSLKLMVENPENIMDSFVWVTVDEIERYKREGYILLNDKKRR